MVDRVLALTFQTACFEWKSILGSENVITEGASLQFASLATFATHQRVPAILKPQCTADVQRCLRVATRYGIPVYPISSGKNWGYGSRVPPADNCVLLDLSAMKRILEFDEDLAYVTVEPGVTQRQLFEFLRERKSHLWIDATGSSPDCSLIGNTMERGFGHTPYGDHFGNVCGFEVVLPNGEILRTGSRRVESAKAAPVYRWGAGPSIDGLFTQSNLGIVTRMTLWLMPAPEYFQAFFFRCDDADALEPLIDALRPLRLNGTLRNAVHIGNDYKVLAGIQQFPWGEETPLSPASMMKFRRELNFGAWNGSGGLYGTRAQVAEARRLVRRALKGKVSRLQFLDDRLLEIAARFSRPFSLLSGWDLSKALELLRPVYGLMKGVPTEQPLRSAYWRKRTPPPESMDPDRDGCGLLWCAPVAPATGDHARRLTGIATRILLRHGFEPQISLTMVAERALIGVVSIAYDREIQGEDDRAHACHAQLESELMAHDYYSYRLGIQSMIQMQSSPAYARLIQAIKNNVDPSAILAPGRYDPECTAAGEREFESDEAIAAACR